MENKSSNSWCISYTNAQHLTLDGIPVQLNEMLIPKSYQEDATAGIITTSKILQEEFEYNFQTEDGFLEYHKDFLKEKMKDEHRRKTIKKEKQRKPKLPDPKPSSPSPTPSNEEPQTENKLPTVANETKRHSKPLPPPPTPKPSTSTIINNSGAILTPQRVESPAPLIKPIIAVSASSMELSEFEGKGEDPFESAELNTINEKEMLREVLGNSFSATQNPGNTATTTAIASSAQPLKEITESSSNNVKTSDNYPTRPLPPTPNQREESITDAEPANSESKPVSNGKPPPPAIKPKPEKLKTASVSEETVSMESARENRRSTDDNDLTENTENVAPPKPIKPKLLGFSYVADLDNVVLRRAVQNGAPKLPDRAPGSVNSNTTEPPTDPALKTEPLKFTNSKSKIPLPEKTYNIQRPAPPPPRTKSGRPQPPNSKQSAQPPPLTKNGQPPSTNSEQTMPPVRKKNGVNTDRKSVDQVESFLNMGFDKKLINTAIQHYGEDNEKVLDHLINLQNLTASSGLSGSVAQDALLLYPSDQKQANQYMSSCKKLLEYGFKQEAIKQALLKSNLNDEEALDILCSGS